MRVSSVIVEAVSGQSVFSKQSGGGGKAMSFGKSKAKMQKSGDNKKVTFDDVAGLDEEKEEPLIEEVIAEEENKEIVQTDICFLLIIFFV